MHNIINPLLNLQIDNRKKNYERNLRITKNKQSKVIRFYGLAGSELVSQFRI